METSTEMPYGQDEEMYRCLVVDSGPIIRLTGATTLWKQAKKFYTVPAVLQEIRDAKARQHLDSLPFELIPREASPEGIHAVVEFARLTGDYPSLSSVDLQVLGLLYDLEKEGCGGDVSHIRKAPKRMLGLGKIESLGEEKKIDDDDSDAEIVGESVEADEQINEGPDTDHAQAIDTTTSTPRIAQVPSAPKTWAVIVNPRFGSNALPVVSAPPAKIADQVINASFGQMNIGSSNSISRDPKAAGQFSDADDDTLEGNEAEADNDLEEVARSLEEELTTEFPSLAASHLVPYDGSDDEGDEKEESKVDPTGRLSIEELENRKLKSLQPVSKSGKLYNTLGRYNKLLEHKTEPPKREVTSKQSEKEDIKLVHVEEPPREDSRIIGGMEFSGQGLDVEDDGEGWIVSTEDIRTMKGSGVLDPMRGPKDLKGGGELVTDLGPRQCARTACTTTDFAMQNVILQMNLELLSVDGIKVRKVKSWVTRCGACFKVYTNADNMGPIGNKRLFCDHCGSDMMQRVAASVDGKTGRLRLHLSKKYKHNLRGTKFSLPKPGGGNRFQGDLLLREDQLLTGVWNQKVKMKSGGKSRAAAQSIFGKDIATNVGCHAQLVSGDDVRVGFGRRNPNAAKGRERRGKKKKTTDKACGLRRY